MNQLYLHQKYFLAFFTLLFCFPLSAISLLAEEQETTEVAADKEEPGEEEEFHEVYDPFERWNRGIFWFNDKMDRYLLEPVSDGYDSVMPDRAQKGVSNFFENLSYPKYLVSSVVQLNFSDAASHTGRFLINTTLGLVGLVDVAKHLGLERKNDDFGTALGAHGVPPGPYVVLPLFGSSNFRDGFGRVVDNFLNPIPWVAAETADGTDALLITTGATALDVIQFRADYDEAVEAARDASVDYYLFVRSAYYQRRKALIEDLGSSASKSTEQGEEENPFAEDEAFDAEFAESE